MLLLLAASAHSQQAKFRVTHYDETSGLQTNAINAIMQNKNGYMWFGTAESTFKI